MRITAKVDYAVRAALELAAAEGGPVKGERIAEAQGIPLKFLENILLELRGPEGGYWLARPAAAIMIADVIRAVEGPLASVRGVPPEEVAYPGASEALRTVWVALRANLRAVLDEVTLADVVEHRLPAAVTELTEVPGAWLRR